jgi:hypothetical protein
LGRAIREHGGLVLVTGGFQGFEHCPESSTDWHVVSGFLGAADPRGADMLETLLPDPALDQGNILRFSRGAVTVLHGRGSQARRFATVEHVDAFVTVNADNATQQMIELALALRKPVLPLPFSGTVEEECWQSKGDVAQFEKAFSLSPDDSAWLRQVRLEDPVDGVASRIVSFLTRCLRKRCFIVMKYGDCNDAVYREAIEPAVIEAGYLPVRADEIAHIGDAVAALREEIHASDLVIALLDHASLNVAYEIGFAHALGKPVVLASSFHPEALPFDLRNWQVCTAPRDDLVALREKLRPFIRSAHSV